LSEPAWVTRFANGIDGSEIVAISKFVAREIADEVRELLIYKRACESMARQMIHPKMTGLELAKMQLSTEEPTL
jgi:hypothetical protein